MCRSKNHHLATFHAIQLGYNAPCPYHPTSTLHPTGLNKVTGPHVFTQGREHLSRGKSSNCFPLTARMIDADAVAPPSDNFRSHSAYLSTASIKTVPIGMMSDTPRPAGFKFCKLSRRMLRRQISLWIMCR